MSAFRDAHVLQLEKEFAPQNVNFLEMLTIATKHIVFNVAQDTDVAQVTLCNDFWTYLVLMRALLKDIGWASF